MHHPRIWNRTAQAYDATADRSEAENFLRISGGWPVELDRFGVKRASRSWQVRIEELQREARRHPAKRLREEFGLTDEAEVVLRGLAGANDPFDGEIIEIVSAEVGVDPGLVLGFALALQMLRDQRSVVQQQIPPPAGNRRQQHPLDLDIGELTGMVQRPGFDPEVRRDVRRMHRWRNELAHLRPLSANDARLLAGR